VKQEWREKRECVSMRRRKNRRKTMTVSCYPRHNPAKSHVAVVIKALLLYTRSRRPFLRFKRDNHGGMKLPARG